MNWAWIRWRIKLFEIWQFSQVIPGHLSKRLFTQLTQWYYKNNHFWQNVMPYADVLELWCAACSAPCYWHTQCIFGIGSRNRVVEREREGGGGIVVISDKSGYLVTVLAAKVEYVHRWLSPASTDAPWGLADQPPQLVRVSLCMLVQKQNENKKQVFFLKYLSLLYCLYSLLCIVSLF